MLKVLNHKLNFQYMNLMNNIGIKAKSHKF